MSAIETVAEPARQPELYATLDVVGPGGTAGIATLMSANLTGPGRQAKHRRSP